jgi:hypothetical protein
MKMRRMKGDFMAFQKAEMLPFFGVLEYAPES